MMTNRPLLRVWLAGLLIAVASSSALGQADNSFDRILVDPQIDSTQRSSLVQQMLNDGSYEALGLALEQAPGLVGEVLLEQIAAMEPADRTSDVFRLLRRVVEFNPEDRLDRALAVLLAHRERDAIRVCLALLVQEDIAASKPMALRVMRVLEEQTGQTTMQDDPDRWSAWWVQVEWLPELQWLNQLVEAHAARARDAQIIVAAQLAEMIDLYTRMYAQSSEAQRAAIVSEMLVHQNIPMRRAGLDLIERGVVNGRLPNPAVQSLVSNLLLDTDASVRSRAAIVSVRSLNASPGDVLVEALSAEQDPAVATELLHLAARWPSVAGIQALWRWVEAPATRTLAIEALATAAQHGDLDLPTDRHRALRILADVSWSDASIPEIRLASALGQRDLLRRMIQQIPAMTGANQLEAIRAAIEQGVMTRELAEVCAVDSTLLVPIRDALLQTHPNVQGLRMLLACSRATEPVSASQRVIELVVGFLQAFPADIQQEMLESALELQDSNAVWDESLRRGLESVLRGSEADTAQDGNQDETS
jgi:hypothetical protein